MFFHSVSVNFPSKRNYLRDVSRLATWLGRPTDTATDEDLRRYQIEHVNWRGIFTPVRVR
jgi:hypothetical protein